jgi:uncharacterized membrane protein YfcA
VDPGPIKDALTVVVGVGTGVLSAAFGVGGAVVSTPAIRALGVPALLAVGTTLPSIFPSAVTGTVRYVKEDLILWRVVATTAPAGVVSAVLGAELADDVPGEGHFLMVLTALLLGYTALRMARKGPTPPAAAVGSASEQAARERSGFSAQRTDSRVLVAVGALAGLMSGLLGIGGGVVMVPGFTELAKIPLKTAIATSLACVAIFAIPSTITHAVNHNIDWRIALFLAIGVIPGARFGSAAAVKSSDEGLRKSVAGFLGLIAVVYFIGEIVALFD